MRTEIALGTAQLGMDYGISNTQGVPDGEQALEILRKAAAMGVTYLDTAQAYGQSEELLGGLLHGGLSDQFKIVTKIHDSGRVESVLKESLQRLKLHCVWGILFHNETVLDSWSEVVAPQLESLKKKQLVSGVGVSVYTPEYAEKALLLDGVDIIQVPANVFDRRLWRTGWFERASCASKKVFVRSLFLQGFMFLGEEKAKTEVDVGGDAIRALQHFCREHDIDKKTFALQFVQHIAPGAVLLFGAEAVGQVAETIRLIREPKREEELFDQWNRLWPQDYQSLINPLNWARYQRR